MLWLLLTPPLLALLWLFLICPRLPRRNADAFLHRDYAHRGLWNEQFPENSLPAFQRAAQCGFGIELDVHLTADDRLCVIHDDDVSRMCGVPMHVHDSTLSQLQALRLKGTDYGIPTLAEVLDTVAGRVPLIVELKSGPRNHVLCRLVLEALEHDQGASCIESFDPRIVRWFRRNAPHVFRGQLAEYPEHPRGQEWLMGQLWQHVISRPDFIAWNVNARESLAFRCVKTVFRPWLVGWTVREEGKMVRLRKEYDGLIFERFWNEPSEGDNAHFAKNA